MGINQYSLSRQAGIGFVEVLVSLIILGIGLLGVLTMQRQALVNHQQAFFATEANLLAEDMASRILASYTDASGNYALAVDAYDGLDSTDNTSAPQVAADRDAWIAALTGSSLSAVVGNVDWTDPNNDDNGIYTITLRWNQERRNNINAGTIAADCADNDPEATFTCFQMELEVYDQ